MRKIFLFPLTLLILILILTGAGFVWWTSNIKAPSSDAEVRNFLIPKGRSAIEIGNELHEEGFIKSPLAFKIYVQISGKSKNIAAGEYRLPSNLTLPEIVTRLEQGPSQLWVTIPEGLRREEVLEKFLNGLDLDGEARLNFKSQFLAESQGNEGYLFPDTYLLPRDFSGSRTVQLMLNTFDKRVNNAGIDAVGDELEEIVIIASLIEREAKSKEERPIIAGIIYNRLEAQMPLQIDAAVQYAVGDSKCLNQEGCNWWPVLTRDDLEISSQYNTYRYSGLPPAPIANPGITSLEAAANPQDSDYFYYIHDDEGNIHFSETLEEHNQNIQQYLR